MIIKNIKFNDTILDFSNNMVNIVTGHTGDNKTLLFYAFEFLFCIDSSINLEEAKKNLGSDYISAEFVENDNSFVLKRKFSPTFNAYIDDVEFDKSTQYKKKLAERFNFNQIYIQNGDKKNQFFLKDYIKIIMIPEEQLTSTKNIFERYGEIDKVKMHLFFNYMISGKSVNVELIKKGSEIQKSEKTISSIKTTFNRVFSKPKKKELDDYAAHEELVLNYTRELDEYSLKKKNLAEKIDSLKLENKRFDTLLNSYGQDLKDYDLRLKYACSSLLIDLDYQEKN